MLAAVLATDERLIALQYLMRISAHLGFSSSAQKDDSHWGPSPDSRVGVVSSFAHKKTNNSMLFVTGRFQQQSRHIYYS